MAAPSNKSRSSALIVSKTLHPSPSGRVRSSPSFFTPSASPVRFSLDRLPHSFGGDSITAKKPISGSTSRKTCLCSPTTHPGSFRCNLHKGKTRTHPMMAASSSRLHARRSAMANSLVRIGTVEEEWVNRALAALIRPCGHHQRRRVDFQPRPSRLSVMSKIDPGS